MGPIAKMIFWIICLLCTITPFLEAARILAIIPVPSYSHQVAFQSIWSALSRRGHEVIVLTTNPINDPSLTNLTEINCQESYETLEGANHVESMRKYTWITLERIQMFDIGHTLTENIYKHPEVRKMYALNSNQKFDLIIAEVVKTPGLYPLAHRFNAPIIGKNKNYIAYIFY